MPRFAANLTMLFNEAPFLDRFALAARAGFEGVEYLFPYEFDKTALRGELDRHGLTQVLHNLPAGDWAGGERGIAILPDRIDEFRKGVATAIDYATALGCRQVNCLVGIAPDGVPDSVLRTTLVANLKLAAAELGKCGIRLLIEPINRFDIPGFYLNTVGQASSIIEEVGSDNLFIQYDLYHQQRTEGELVGTYRRYREKIAHIQLADNPGRNEPATGEINYPFVFDALEAGGYDGWIGCEYKPLTTTAEGLGWLGTERQRKQSADIIQIRS
ncbi:hydroxypyruvate isomerase [Sinorhizobium meliloti]|uniref:hydroxypyruvate isomerase n=1 Tax=Rhizobium meliloti TaxID=382 RepID=UPI000FD59EBE|nr:hydroxypyruvate isomerase [Sinorhizobium meliloti]MQW58231.1 hydroxypyruvate isomerase [Sinorhizobium meliloti]MQX64744.1 hydroxypyruvate isomerase [Sinorhizobium meliloti]RVI64750.1 hydroxypyruvate isomerase [Sinorhizobium meliloti]RVJ57307.1 hydroxypyruvate isomerase [Sinorhizobium meliloti]RVJ68056.1 hydroxypyruvate isomerase [Sinorhizobium meliloti]